MKTLSDSQIFVENPFRSLKIIAPVFVLFLLLVVVIFGFYGVTPKGRSQGISSEGFIFMIFFAVTVVLAVTILAMSFTRKKIVTCDTNGCQVQTTNYWESYHESDSFRWSEVTDTNLVEEFFGKGQFAVVIEVKAGHQPKRLLSNKLSAKEDFNELLKLINQQTLHLPHVWKEASDFGSRQVINIVQKYCKVARIN